MVSFITIKTLTDTQYTEAGTTQYTRGYGKSVTGSAIDDVTFVNRDLQSTDVILINNISEYQIFQRNDSNQADISISGTYTGSPSGVEASFNGGAYTTIDANPSGGTFSGSLLAQSVGQGALSVRFVNNTGAHSSVNNVGVGDIFVISGQSNASGRGNTLNSYNHNTLKAALFGNDDNWKELTDGTDRNSGQVDDVSRDAGQGSPWPIVATNILASHGIPVAFVPTAKGGSSTLQWQPSANHSDASTLYGSMNRRITAIGGLVKGVLFFQGESDAKSGITQATYETRLGVVVNTIESDFTGTKTMIGQIGHSNRAGNDAIRAGQIALINANSNALLGPATYDINLADEGGDTLHFKSDGDMADFASRWYAAIDKEFYGGADGYGPILNTANLEYNPISNKITVPFTDDSFPVISPSSPVTKDAFNLKNNGISVAITSIAIVGSAIEIEPIAALNTAQSITLTYASLNDALDKAIYDNNNLPAQPFYEETVSINAINTISEVVFLSNSGLLTQAALTAAGVTNTGLTTTEITAIEMAVAAANPVPTTTNELQTIVDAALSTVLKINSFHLQSFKMYPNPSSGIVNIEDKAKNIKVFDVFGKQILEFNNTKVFNIEMLQLGEYFVKIETVNDTLIKRLLKSND